MRKMDVFKRELGKFFNEDRLPYMGGKLLASLLFYSEILNLREAFETGEGIASSLCMILCFVIMWMAFDDRQKKHDREGK